MSFAHLGDVLDEVRELGLAFAAAGYRLFLVGGIVRDQWLDEPLDGSSDIDLTTDARPVEIKGIVSPLAGDLWTQGEKFGTIGMRIEGRDFEITTHRAESYSSESRKPQVSFGDNIDVDLSRRDFTVNAMAIEVPDGDLVDPHGGTTDLHAGLLRTPLSADISFSDDPLRMLRAARFATRFGLAPSEEVVASATELHQRLRIVAIERIGVEMRRLLSLANAQVGLRFLADTGLLSEVLSYGNPSLIKHVQPRLDVAIASASQLTTDWHQRLAAIGIAVFDDADGVYDMCRRLKLSRDHERSITRMSRSAMDLVATSVVTPEVLRRWSAATEDRDAAFALAAVFGESAHVRAFRDALDELHQVEGSTAPALLTGDQIMALLELGPGRAVGEAHAYLRDYCFEHGPADEATQTDLLRSWWTSQGH